MKRAGMDEVGRAAFAGPLVACVCKLKTTTTKKQIKFLLGSLLRDSKKLSESQQKIVLDRIGKLVRFKVTAITVEEINEYGLGWANTEIMRRLSKLLPAKKYIVDGNMKFGNGFDALISKVKADTKVAEVMLAATIAKYHRDAYMVVLHQEFPEYGWDTNAGYGTKKHRAAIIELGTTPHHRNKFVESYLNKLKQTKKAARTKARTAKR
jgi:ribonuclease HII